MPHGFLRNWVAIGKTGCSAIHSHSTATAGVTGLAARPRTWRRPLLSPVGRRWRFLRQSRMDRLASSPRRYGRKDTPAARRSRPPATRRRPALTVRCGSSPARTRATVSASFRTWRHMSPGSTEHGRGSRRMAISTGPHHRDGCDRAGGGFRVWIALPALRGRPGMRPRLTGSPFNPCQGVAARGASGLDRGLPSTDFVQISAKTGWFRTFHLC